MADRLNAMILKEALIRKWKNANNNGDMKYDKDNSAIKNEKSRNYYFKDPKDNLIVFPMCSEDKNDYGSGAGHELNLKMKAIHSSSAMTYNIFCNKKRNRKVSIASNPKLPEGEYALEYEKKLTALSSPANLDACLISEKKKDTVLLFEMKMTEWLLGGPSKLSLSYNPYNHPHYPEAFADLIKEYINKNGEEKPEIVTERDSEGKISYYYKCKNNYFDVFQIVKHMMGIYNGLKDDKAKYSLPKETKIVKLIIGYWTIPNVKDFFTFDNNKGIDKKKLKAQIDKYSVIKEKMEQEIDDFISNAKFIKVVELFEKVKVDKVDFEVIGLTAEEIITCLGKQDVPELKRYI